MNTIKEIKHEFYAYRNGIIADTLRPLMPCYNVIFGLQVPQLAAIVRATEASPELAAELWADRRVRESRLLAPYLMDPSTLTVDDALTLCGDVQTREEADMLAFRLLKRSPLAKDILAALERAAQDQPESEPIANSVKALRAHVVPGC